MANFISRVFSRRVAADASSVPTVETNRMAADGLTNYLTGMGSIHDVERHDRYLPESGIDQVTADAIFRSDWLGKRIVSTIADDMVREWRNVMWDGSQDEDGVFDIVREENRLQVRKKVHSAIKWARQYGGSIVVMIPRGASREVMSEPLDVEKVKKGDLVNLVVYDRWRVYGTPAEARNYSRADMLTPYFNQDLSDPNYGLPDMYYLADVAVPIHHTRCIRFDGEELPWSEWLRNGMWHDSVFKTVYRALKSYGALMAGASTLVRKANVDVFSSAGLADLLSSNAGTTQAQQRYHLLSLMMSMYGIAVLDKDQESFERKPVTFTGLRELCDRFALDVAGAADVPLTRLFGQSPGGLNATGDSDAQNYDAHIAARQVSDVSPQLEKLDQVMVRSALGYMPDDYRSEWNPLRVMTKKEEAEINEANARTASAYLDRDVLRPEHVARELRANGVYPNLTQEDGEDADQDEEMVSTPPQPPPPPPPPVRAEVPPEDDDAEE
jgi:phage-related protein (TIGR01555 family)